MEQDPGFAPLTLPALRRCHEAMDDRAGLGKLLSAMVSKHPGLKAGLAYAAIVDEGFDDPITRECIADFIRRNPMLTDLMSTLRPDAVSDAESEHGLRRITRALAHALRIQSELSLRELRFLRDGPAVAVSDLQELGLDPADGQLQIRGQSRRAAPRALKSLDSRHISGAPPASGHA